MTRVRLNMDVSADVVRMLDHLADREGVTRTEMVRRGLSVVKALDDQMRKGRRHLVFTAEPGPGDVELVGILTPPPDADRGRTGNGEFAT